MSDFAIDCLRLEIEDIGKALPTLRDFFAMHAPAPPDWFQPKTELGPMPPIDTAARTEWKARREMARLLRWRWHYADCMLIARNGGVLE